MGLRKTEEEVGITACVIARDVKTFDLLIEDMEAELGPAWGGLNFEDGIAFLSSPLARELEFVTVAVDRTDEENLEPVIKVIKAAESAGIKVILVAHDLSPVALHQLLRLGAADFAPYPLPEGALHEAIERIRTPASPPLAPVRGGGAETARDGVIMPVYGLAGGVGATTFAVNLGWELSRLSTGEGYKTCILDLDLQMGSVSTYLDLPRREAIFELLSDIGSMDREAFMSALQPFNEMQVLTAPAESLPYEMLTSEDVNALLDMAKSQFDFVIVDVPKTLIQWSEVLINRADIYFALIEMDMRSAQNALRFIRTLKAEDLPMEKVKYILNRAPKFTDLSGRSRVKRLAENLNIELEILLPDGGKAVVDSCDQGLPLAETAAKNPLRKDMMKLAKSIFDLVTSQAEAKGGK